MKNQEIYDNLTQYSWEMILHGTFDPDVTFTQADKLLGAWRSHAARSTGCQLATCGFFLPAPGQHVHVLMLGQNRAGRSLNDVYPQTWIGLQELWKNMTHRTAQIDPVRDNGAVGYIVNYNISRTPGWRTLTPHNTRLLKSRNRAYMGAMLAS